jgi:hypothetical protein
VFRGALGGVGRSVVNHVNSKVINALQLPITSYKERLLTNALDDALKATASQT